ncbi:MAG: dihydrofolate reductase [Desulfitobacteriaceae bacterium]
MKLIASVDLNWGIGYNNNLLERIPNDLKFFKEKTINKVVVMGRTTYESLPGPRPLSDRINIILTNNKNLNYIGVVKCFSINQLFGELSKYNKEDIFVIGGEQIFAQLLPFCTEAFITKIRKEYKADRFLLNLDNDDNWKISYESNKQDYENICFNFTTYKRVKSGELVQL